MGRRGHYLLVVLFLFSFSVYLPAQRKSQRDISSKQLDRLLERASKGDIPSQVRLGIAYQYGDGVPFDAAKAELWLRRAAEFGNPQAQVQLGLLYLRPEFLSSRSGEAERWFTRAAASGFAPAEYNLGLMHQSGQGATIDKAEAERWIRKAACHGLGVAKAMFAILLMESGSKESEKEAFALLSDTAKRGDADAQNALGYCYESGRGTAKNLAKAMESYRRAAKSGNPGAMQNLGHLYYFGSGVSKDVAEAGGWYKSACDRARLIPAA